MPDALPPDQPHAARRNWMAVLARARADAIASLLGTSGGMPEYRKLRGPESGLVMVRGRTGGGGAAFNLGEMTVTRCTVRNPGGQVGHAYIAGRDGRRAELAACVDAAMQDASLSDALRRAVIEPLAHAQQAARDATARRAAATRVQFFTMATMRTDDRSRA
jgi:alpha-D-ribose 1-methylphosphonate 5-triphosphate synthase subunit PhnG